MRLEQIVEKFGETWLKFEEFGMERKFASEVLGEWMDTYSERHKK